MTAATYARSTETPRAAWTCYAGHTVVGRQNVLTLTVDGEIVDSLLACDEHAGQAGAAPLDRTRRP